MDFTELDAYLVFIIICVIAVFSWIFISYHDLFLNIAPQLRAQYINSSDFRVIPVRRKNTVPKSDAEDTEPVFRISIILWYHLVFIGTMLCY